MTYSITRMLLVSYIIILCLVWLNVDSRHREAETKPDVVHIHLGRNSIFVEGTFVLLDAALAAPIEPEIDGYLWWFTESNDPSFNKTTILDHRNVVARLDMSRLLVDRRYTIGLVRYTRRENYHTVYHIDSEPIREDIRELAAHAIKLIHCDAIDMMAPFILPIMHFMFETVELHRGFLIYYQYYRDSVVSLEQFQSQDYRLYWASLGLSTSHYEASANQTHVEPDAKLARAYFERNHNKYYPTIVTFIDAYNRFIATLVLLLKP